MDNFFFVFFSSLYPLNKQHKLLHILLVYGSIHCSWKIFAVDFSGNPICRWKIKMKTKNSYIKKKLKMYKRKPIFLEKSYCLSTICRTFLCGLLFVNTMLLHIKCNKYKEYCSISTITKKLFYSIYDILKM